MVVVVYVTFLTLIQILIAGDHVCIQVEILFGCNTGQRDVRGSLLQVELIFDKWHRGIDLVVVLIGGVRLCFTDIRLWMDHICHGLSDCVIFLFFNYVCGVAVLVSVFLIFMWLLVILLLILVLIMTRMLSLILLVTELAAVQLEVFNEVVGVLRI